ncbi:unnamed protein product [Moneuplotes crassus]|uniref:Uncharacterized protein n=1 Tax=Euplotes crassus TaxID=5936 RepID=A0AAD1XPW9_EUPCR|nr:unnamed protein product [Moneuplotes crassus]
MGCCATNNADDKLYKANQKYLQQTTEQQLEMGFDACLPSKRRETRAPVLERSYASEESEYESDDSDNSYLNDPDYYNTKARLKSKFMPFLSTGKELKIFSVYKYSGGQKANNLPFWPQVFHFLSIEDIEISMLCCKRFYEAAQDERILEKFLDSDNEESDSEDSDAQDEPVLSKNASNNYSNKGKSSAWKAASKKIIPKTSDQYLSPYEENSKNGVNNVILASRKRSESWTKISIQKKRRNTIIKMHNQSILQKNKDAPAIRLRNMDPIECEPSASVSSASVSSVDNSTNKDNVNNNRQEESFFSISPCEPVNNNSSRVKNLDSQKRKQSTGIEAKSKQSFGSQARRKSKKSFKYRRDSILKRLKFKPILKFSQKNERENDILKNIQEKMEVYNKQLSCDSKDEENKFLKLQPSRIMEQTTESSREGQAGYINPNVHMTHEKGESSPKVMKHKFDIKKHYEQTVNNTNLSKEDMQGIPYPETFVENLKSEDIDLRKRIEKNISDMKSNLQNDKYRFGKIRPFNVPDKELEHKDTRDFYRTSKN